MTSTDTQTRQARIEELLSHAAALISTEADEASPWHASRGITAPKYRDLSEHVRQARLEAARLFAQEEEVPVIEPAAAPADEAPATETRTVRADTLTRGDVVRIHDVDYTVEGLERVWTQTGVIPPADALEVRIDFGASCASTVEADFELELVSRRVSDQVAGDVLTAALEGGIGYWSMAAQIVRMDTLRRYAGDVPVDGPDDLTVVSVRLEPATNAGLEADEFEPVVVTLDSIRKGLTRTAAETSKVARVHRDAARRLIDGDENDDFDVDDADVIVQMAVFGEVVYG